MRMIASGAFVAAFMSRVLFVRVHLANSKQIRMHYKAPQIYICLCCQHFATTFLPISARCLYVDLADVTKMFHLPLWSTFVLIGPILIETLTSRYRLLSTAVHVLLSGRAARRDEVEAAGCGVGFAAAFYLCGKHSNQYVERMDGRSRFLVISGRPDAVW